MEVVYKRETITEAVHGQVSSTIECTMRGSLHIRVPSNGILMKQLLTPPSFNGFIISKQGVVE